MTKILRWLISFGSLYKLIAAELLEGLEPSCLYMFTPEYLGRRVDYIGLVKMFCKLDVRRKLIVTSASS